MEKTLRIPEPYLIDTVRDYESLGWSVKDIGERETRNGYVEVTFTVEDFNEEFSNLNNIEKRKILTGHQYAIAESNIHGMGQMTRIYHAWIKGFEAGQNAYVVKEVDRLMINVDISTIRRMALYASQRPDDELAKVYLKNVVEICDKILPQ